MDPVPLRAARLMRPSLTKKLGLLLLIPLLGAGLTAYLFVRFLQATAAESSTMNVAGQQRMLSVQLGAYAHMVWMGREEDRQPLREMVTTFDRSLAALEHGGEASGRHLPPAPPEVQDALSAVKGLWSELKPRLLVIVDRPSNDPQFLQAFRELEVAIDALRTRSDELAAAFESRGIALRRRMALVLASIVGLDLLLLVIGVWLVRRFVVRPVLLADEAARRVAGGDLSVRLDVGTRDELSVLATSYNQMVTKVGLAQQETMRSYELQRVLGDLLRLSLTDLGLEEMLGQAIDVILAAPLLGLEHKGSILLVEDESDVLVLKAHRGFSEAQRAACARVPFGRCICGRAAATRQIELTDCVDDRHEIRYEGLEPHGHCDVPVMSGDKLLGVISLYVPEGRRPDERQEEFLLAVANVLAGLVEQERAKEALRRFARQRHALAGLGEMALSRADAQRVTHLAVQNTADALGVELCGILRLEGSADELRLVAGVGWRDGLVGTASVTTGAGSQAGYTLQKCKPVVVRDLAAETRFKGPPVLAEHGVVAGMSVPMATAGRVYGVMGAHTTQRREFSEADVSFLESMAHIVTMVIEGREVDADRARLATAIEQAAEVIVITDPAATIEYVNPAFERVTGYSREQAIGQNPRILKSGKHGKAFYREMWETISSGKTWHGHLTNRRADGTLYEDEATISPVFDATGEIVNYVALKRDVTREVELEEQLRHAQRMEAIGQLAGGVAHDFNNILQAMQMHSTLLLDRVARSSEEHEWVTEVYRGTERAAALTRQLLAFSRRQALETKDLDLNEVIGGLLKMIGRVLGEQIDLAFHPAGEVLAVHADPGQIEQVIVNLCVNARDAMPEGGRLLIQTESVDLDQAFCDTHLLASPGKYAVMAISDTGCGMDQTTRSQIFEPFFTTKEIGKGTGLGLATVYGIVRQHEGLIHVHSEVERGSAFKVYLPMLEGEPTSTEDQRVEEVLGGKETILLAEDDDTLRRITGRVLQRAGYRVIAASNGEEAMAFIEQRHVEIDLLLSDVVMPRKGGKEVLDLFRRLKQNGRALFMSGYSGDAVGHTQDGSSAISFIQKPFSVDSLLRRIREVLD